MGLLELAGVMIVRTSENDIFCSSLFILIAVDYFPRTPPLCITF
jgi:hypothetical protein